MESDDTAIEKILKYLCQDLKGHSSLDLIVAGIFIAEDYTKMEKVSKLVKNARQLMGQHSLKREHEIILFEEMIHKLYKIQDGKKEEDNEDAEGTSKTASQKGKKSDIKAKDKMEEEKEFNTPDRQFKATNGAVEEKKDLDNSHEHTSQECNDNHDSSNSYKISNLDELK